ncbi:MAG TPA: kelch repeat-containing protein [Gemmatimonadaceae bacterium]|nr:kelch repeat-containing protein [Gemmatimonadaceae bacterium]
MLVACDSTHCPGQGRVHPEQRSSTSLAVALLTSLLAACGEGSELPGLNEPPEELPGTWTTRAALPTPRQEMPSALIGNSIYTPGGLGLSGGASDVLEVYDVAADSWSSGPAMPGARHHPGVAVSGGRLFVIGGYEPGPFPGPAADDVFIFDPATQQWNSGASMPAPRAAHVSVEFGGRIYSIGGVRNGVVAGTNETYDPALNSWTTLASMPTAREHLAAAVIADRIFVVGGRAPGNLAVLEAYTPATNSWQRLADMPTARGGLAAAAVNGRLYVFGGEVPGVFEETEEYDPVTDTWRRVADMPTPRHGMGAVTVSGVVHVIGGGVVAGLGASGANEVFTPPSQ